MNNNETNPLKKPKRPMLTGNEKVDELLEDGYQCQMSIYNRWIQSQSLPAEQPEISLQEIKDQVATEILEYPATWKDLSESGKASSIDRLCEILAAQFKQPSQPEGKDYDKLKDAFEKLLMQYSPDNKICRNAWMINAGLKSQTEIEARNFLIK